MPSLLEPPVMEEQPSRSGSGSGDGSERGRSPVNLPPSNDGRTSHSPARVPTSAEIDAVIAAAMANAPPPPPPQQEYTENINRSVTPLMTNLLPAAVGADGRVNLFVGNLPYRVRWQDLKDLFRKAGTVLRADVSLGPDNRSRGYGTVLMGSREDAARAIDRYNGYTWQTRTLEVRPDRLPPEYEPQNHAPPHQHLHQHSHSQHHPSRSGMFNFHGGPPFPLSGHLTPHGGPWPPGQGSGRPPFPGGHGSGNGSHGMLVSGLGPSPAAPPMGLSGSSPVPASQSPSAMYGSVSLPLSVQNTGGPAYPQLAASPLAGSLSAGTGTSSSTNLIAIPRESVTPFSHTVSPDPVAPLPGTASPAPGIGPTSRPTSSNGKPPTISSPSKDGVNRAPPPGTLGPLPPPPFAGVKAVVSPTESASAEGSVAALGRSPSLGNTVSPTVAPAPPMPQLEGLAHQGIGLGPPSTLHDRVIFVSNLPLSMQWQDLKDLLRPAGTIIRADVATEANGRPRGFGTALFASEADAARAVTMFNEREIGGQRIRAHLERQSRSDGSQQPDHAGGDVSALGFGQSPPPHSHSEVAQTGQSNGIPPPIDTRSLPDPSARRTSGPVTGETSPIAKLPWSLNTSLQQQTPGRPGSGPNNLNPTPGPHQHTPNFRQLHHPGPISMPTFPPMDHNPLSPLQTRGMPPMTPSMPGFVFNAYPETPPLYPHFMSMSPGIGPFSPGIPVTSPNAFGYNPFLNAAPGAPVNRYPGPNAQGQGGSAALGTPTTQAFPNGPAAGTIHQYAGPPGQPLNISQTLSSQEYFPPISSSAPDTPTPKVGPRGLPGTGNNPLNAKDRLAASSSEEVLVESTQALSLDGQGDGRRPASVPAPRGEGVAGIAVQRSTSEMKGLGLGNSNGLNSAPGRQSLDETRPSTLGVGATAERRASFGDGAR